jgi:hypothetical protein
MLKQCDQSKHVLDATKGLIAMLKQPDRSIDQSMASMLPFGLIATLERAARWIEACPRCSTIGTDALDWHLLPRMG